MKKVIVSILFVAFGAINVFASNETAINRHVLTAFTSEFKDVSDVTWKTGPTYILATFNMNNTRYQALYTPSGEKIGLQTHFNPEKLSPHLKRKLAKKYEGYVIRESVESKNDIGTTYYLAAENEAEIVYLKIEDGALFKVKAVGK